MTNLFSLKIFSLLILLFSLTGCSVFMATQDLKEPDVSVVKIGAERSQVEANLGKPIKFIRKHNGDEAVYLYHGDLEKSYKRAAIYALADVVTFGFAEIITSSTEHMRREQFELVILYDIHGKITEYTLYSNGKPSLLPDYSTT